MLPRQPLRFLLADDPGEGKTVMAGLPIKEMIAHSDLERCLVVAPGSLVEQWQDELGEKFSIEFDIQSRIMIEGAGNDRFRYGADGNCRRHMGRRGRMIRKFVMLRPPPCYPTGPLLRHSKLTTGMIHVPSSLLPDVGRGICHGLARHG